MNHEKLEALEQKIKKSHSNITGIAVQQNGRLHYESYFQGCTSFSRIHVYSVTKSIISALIGIALDKGLIQSIDQKVLDFFPDYIIKKREQTIQQITLRDLLTMTAPFKYRIPPYIKYFSSGDGLTFSLDLLGGPNHTGDFRYTPLIGPDILSGILEKASGQPVLAFATEQLFTPLGITVEHNLTFQSKEEQINFNKSSNISGWAADDAGLNRAGWGLTLSTPDMARLGQLYLNEGLWDGKQIIPAKWIRESTREHSRWKKHNLPYGYLWWIVEGPEPGYAAMGDGGNIIYVNPTREMVVSITAFFRPNVTDRIAFIKEYVEPVFV